MTKIKKEKKKLLIIAAIFTILAIGLSFAIYKNRSSLLFKSLDKYIETKEYIDDVESYPDNISQDLKEKLATVSDDTVIAVYIGHKESVFRLISFDMTKEDILKLANNLASMTFDIKK